MAKKGVGGGFIPHLGVVLYPRPNSKMGEKHKNHLTPDLTSGSDLGRWEPELIGKFF